MHPLHYVNSANGNAQRNSFWTEERTDELKRLWAIGGLLADIAAKLGCTRNAAIAKAYREDLGPLKPDEGRLFEVRSAASKKSWELHPEKMHAGIIKVAAARKMKSASVSCST